MCLLSYNPAKASDSANLGGVTRHATLDQAPALWRLTSRPCSKVRRFCAAFNVELGLERDALNDEYTKAAHPDYCRTGRIRIDVAIVGAGPTEC